LSLNLINRINFYFLVMKPNNYILSNDMFCNKESVLQKNYYVSALITRYTSEYIWIIGKTNLG
jgi:hypothetical protein